MNYEFKNKKDLIEYYEELDDIQKNEFVTEIKNDIKSISIRFNVFRKKIFLLFGDSDPKYVILETGEFAEKAMDLFEPYNDYMTDELINSIASEYVDIYGDEDNYSADEIVDMANEYIELTNKLTYYFSKIWSVSNTYSQCLFGLRRSNSKIEVQKNIINYYSGLVDRSMLKNKYKRALATIDKKFESEWEKIKKNFPCELD